MGRCDSGPPRGLRLANHGHLIAAEDLALAEQAGDSGVALDLDLDGRPEILLANEGEFVAVKTDEGAGLPLGAWRLRFAAHLAKRFVRLRL